MEQDTYVTIRAKVVRHDEQTLVLKLVDHYANAEVVVRETAVVPV